MKKSALCENCGNSFESSFFVPSRTPRYCSKSCANLGFCKKRIIKNCFTCRTSFEIQPFLSNQKYCSVKCIKRDSSHLKKIVRISFWETASEQDKLKKYKDMFEERVIRSDGCWGWKSYIDATGGGRIGSRKNSISHYRISWILSNGPIPDDLLVLHKCHNRVCSNPSHLYLGTNKDNYNDMVNAGRRVSCKQQSKNAKLNVEKVKVIKQMLKDGVSQQKIADKFNVSRGTIQNIKENDMWKDV